jgi:hypothetical protein
MELIIDVEHLMRLLDMYWVVNLNSNTLIFDAEFLEALLDING